jgi:DNA-directed RNA polymerase specialized sigma24 family protein
VSEVGKAFPFASFGAVREVAMEVRNQETAKEKHHAASESPSFAGLANLPEQLVQTLTARMIRIARRIGVPPSLCADVAQEAWLKAAKKADQFRGEYSLCQFCSWLLRCVARGKAIDMLRHLQRRATQSLDESAIDPMDHRALESATVHPRIGGGEGADGE